MSDQRNPYQGLQPEFFWRTAVAEADWSLPKAVYTKKFPITRAERIATAGSCFAQHIGRRLKAHGFTVLDTEPPPSGLDATQHAKFGYSIYSARYGNIYTVRQLLQLVKEAYGKWEPGEVVWSNEDGRFFDAFRSSVEPDGLGSPAEVIAHRRFHLTKVRQLLNDMTLLIFTLGLTEAWIDRATGTTFPMVPGAIAGTYDSERYAFKNFTFAEIYEDLGELLSLLTAQRDGTSPLKIMLTVSPVPLTATASGRHVLQATVYSKSVLRAVAGQFAAEHSNIDYFSSFEIISNPWSRQDYYLENRRSVSNQGVDTVMSVFFSHHIPTALDNGAAPQNAATHSAPRAGSIGEPSKAANAAEDTICDEELLAAFGERAA